MESIGFEFNPYDGCIANRTINKKQHAIRFHVDDLMSSHIDPKVNDEFLAWLNKQYGSHGAVKATRGKVHEFLGVVYDFSEERILKLRMDEYVKRMLDDFSVKFSENDVVKTPGGNDLFERGKGKLLEKERNEEFHSVVAKGIFLGKRARPDIQTINSVLSTRIKGSNKSDWKKLVRLMKYLNGTRGRHLTLWMEDPTTIIWSVDASFGIHDDFISHTGATMTMGRGAILSVSRKQKIKHSKQHRS